MTPVAFDPAGPWWRTLQDLLVRARELGLVGPIPPERQLRHALGFAARVRAPEAGVDLGSGAGLPGLALAARWPDSRWVLTDASTTRASFLADAVRTLGWSERVEVAHGRAEDLARGSLRGTAGLVVARSFASPAVTAECAAGFLAVGGRLVVSEPPASAGERWAPLDSLDLGLVPVEAYSADGSGFQILEQRVACPDRYPRRAGIPTKRPLF